MSSSSVRGRVAVRADLTFGDPPKSQGEEREKEAKFKGALEAVAQREERRKRKPNSPNAAEEAAAPEDDKGTARAPTGAPPPGPARPGRVMAQSPNALDARRRALLDKVPAAQRKPAPAAVPRDLAEAVTDPRMAAPPRELLQTPDESTTPFGDVETSGMGDPLEAAADAAPSNLGDGTSLPTLDEDEFFEVDVDVDESQMVAGASVATDMVTADLPPAAEPPAPRPPVSAGGPRSAAGTADGHPLSRRR